MFLATLARANCKINEPGLAPTCDSGVSVVSASRPETTVRDFVPRQKNKARCTFDRLAIEVFGKKVQNFATCLKESL